MASAAVQSHFGSASGLGLIVSSFCSICQTLMVLLEVGQTSASFQALFAGSACSPSGNNLVFGRQRQKSVACSSHTRSKLKQGGRNTRRASVVSSALTADLLSVGFFSAAAAGLLYSATPLLTGKAKQANQGKSDGYGETDAEPEGIKWGAMSVVSFIPLVNWTVSCNARLQAWYTSSLCQLVLCKLSLILQAWVFAAIDDEEQATKYYAFAAVYALPLLRNGFTFDGFLAAAVLVCAAHVQVQSLYLASKQDSPF